MHCFRVHLRDHQWNLLVHPKRRAIVHHYAPPIHRDGPELLADGPAGAEQSNVDAVEALRRQLLHHILLLLERHAAAGGALRRQHFYGAVGEVAVGEDGEELLTDGAGHPNHRDGGSVFFEGHSDLTRARVSGLGPGLEGRGEEVGVPRKR